MAAIVESCRVTLSLYQVFDGIHHQAGVHGDQEDVFVLLGCWFFVFPCPTYSGLATQPDALTKSVAATAMRGKNRKLMMVSVEVGLPICCEILIGLSLSLGGLGVGIDLGAQGSDRGSQTGTVHHPGLQFGERDAQIVADMYGRYKLAQVLEPGGCGLQVSARRQELTEFGGQLLAIRQLLGNRLAGLGIFASLAGLAFDACLWLHPGVRVALVVTATDAIAPGAAMTTACTTVTATITSRQNWQTQNKGGSSNQGVKMTTFQSEPLGTSKVALWICRRAEEYLFCNRVLLQRTAHITRPVVFTFHGLIQSRTYLAAATP